MSRICPAAGRPALAGGRTRRQELTGRMASFRLQTGDRHATLMPLPSTSDDLAATVPLGGRLVRVRGRDLPRHGAAAVTPFLPNGISLSPAAHLLQHRMPGREVTTSRLAEPRPFHPFVTKEQ